jgi:Domain of unknown function (DUF4159)/Aerotolerance regulator N-terminal
VTIGALSFLSPWLLAGLASLPLIYWLLRTVPPRPQQIVFPPTRILAQLENRDKTPAKTPWWLLLLRLIAAALVIFALAEPIWDSSKQKPLAGSGPVAIVVDNSWAAAPTWDLRADMIDRLITEVERQNRSIVLVPTAVAATASKLQIMAPADARIAARAIVPEPFSPERKGRLDPLKELLATTTGGNAIIWLHDGIRHTDDTSAFAAQLGQLADKASFVTLDAIPGREPLGLIANVSADGKLQATVVRTAGTAQSGFIHALSARNKRLAEAEFQFAPGARSTTASFNLPLELRNQVTRLVIAGKRSAGAVQLLDGRSHWQRVGLISGGDQEQAQPLLSPLYYIEKALKPFSEIVRSKDANLAAGLNDLINQDATVLTLTDIGTLTGQAREDVEAWVNRGGVLIRFAGPRLEKGSDALLPTPLRRGGRSLGGALSWSTPQPLADFEPSSPFSGLEIPSDVSIKRQVLADPAQMDPDTKVWARLKDGTPLVTARAVGQGQVVLFHITANSDWSNLPMSGVFVDMLRRISSLGNLNATAKPKATKDDGGEATSAKKRDQPDPRSTTPERGRNSGALAPIQTLDGFGSLGPPPPTIEAIAPDRFSKLTAGPQTPPGYYGAAGQPRAINVLTQGADLKPLLVSAAGVEHRSYQNRAAVPMKHWLLATALALLFLDVLAVLFLQTGGRPWRRATKATASATGIILTSVVILHLATATNAAAQQFSQPPPKITEDAGEGLSPDAIGQLATANVTLGYVKTGDPAIDKVSRAGLQGLGKVLRVRTAIEPGPPIGIDIDTAEIAFYPIIYWPVAAESETLKETTLAKIDAYMKQGGMIIFDTRDHGSGLPTGVPLSGEGGTALQRLLGQLDLPRLEPVPEEHVLTKAFYLLQSFPGRWDGGELWVEAEGSVGASDSGKARRADGVTSIMITSNDFAAAWALDERGRGMYPTVPGAEEQREMAFRTGINIVMHALTGNYKADQVHVPSLLERLGQ